MEWEDPIDFEGESASSCVEGKSAGVEEAFALTLDKPAFLAQLLPGSLDRIYLETLWQLQQIQLALGSSSNQVDEAKTILLKHKETIEKAADDLRNRFGCSQRAKRVLLRLRLLQLEVLKRENIAGEQQQELQKLTRELAKQLDLSICDAPPANTSTSASSSSLPSTLDAKLVDQDELFKQTIKTLTAVAAEPISSSNPTSPFVVECQKELNKLSPFFREKLFEQAVADVCASKKLGFSELQRTQLMELFLTLSLALEFCHLPRLLAVICEDLHGDHALGSRQVHERLSLTQWQELLQLEPSLRDDIWLAVRMVQLLQASWHRQQENQVTWEAFHSANDRRQKIEFLGQALQLLREMSPCVNGVRFVLLYNQLELELLDTHCHSNESSPLDRLSQVFLQFVGLPRIDSGFINPIYISQTPHAHFVSFHSRSLNSDTRETKSIVTAVRSSARSVFGAPHKPVVAIRNQNDNFSHVDSITTALGMDRISMADDQQLTAKVLEKLLAHESVTKRIDEQLSKVLDAKFLKKQRATAMMKSGQGEVATWMHDLQDYNVNLDQLANCSEISFCEGNAKRFAWNEPVRFAVQVRNIQQLHVQLFEIKTTEYFTRKRREITADICLEGLLPNEEQVIDVSPQVKHPWQETRVMVEFESLQQSKRGVYIVEVFEKGISCRALLRKGFLRYFERATLEGHEVFVLDEVGEVVREASVMVLDRKGGRSPQSTREFEADATGKIRIPFRHTQLSSDSFAMALCHDHFAMVVPEFTYLKGEFTLEGRLHVDSEQLVPGARAKATLLNGSVTLAGSTQRFALDSLRDITMSCEFSTGGSITVRKDVKRFDSMSKLLENASNCCFEIPMEACSLELVLSARVAREGSNSTSMNEPSVQVSKTFQVQRMADYANPFTAHLMRRVTNTNTLASVEGYVKDAQYVVLILGHNGEPIADVEMDLRVKHLHFQTPLKAKLRTDPNGVIQLGGLKNVEYVEATMSTIDSKRMEFRWNLPNQCVNYPDALFGSVGEEICVPLATCFAHEATQWLDKELISLCESQNIAGSCIVLESIQAKTTKLRLVMDNMNQAVGVAFTPVKASKLVLFIRPINAMYYFTICPKTQTVACDACFLVQKQALFRPNIPLPLLILNQQVQQKQLRIQVANATSDTQLCVIFKRFIDLNSADLGQILNLKKQRGDGLQDCLMRDSTSVDAGMRMALRDNEFLKKRKFSDEYAYILTRRAVLSGNGESQIRMGLLLPKPSLIQNPHVIGESDMEDVVMREGEAVKGFVSADRENALNQAKPNSMDGMGRAMMKKSFVGRGRRALACKLARSSSSSSQASSVAFLACESETLWELRVDSDGQLTIPLESLAFFQEPNASALFEVVVIAFDHQQVSTCQTLMQMPMNKPVGSLSKRDLRLSDEETLMNSKNFVRRQSHEPVGKGEVRVLDRSCSSKNAIYTSLGSAMDLWGLFCSDREEVKLLTTTLKKWHVLSFAEKVRFYCANAADELHVFLFKKDRVFFDKVIKSVVQAKVCKSLIDYYLLGDGECLRAKYLRLGVFGDLNVVEKLLIAERMDPVKATQICESVMADIDNHDGYENAPIVLRKVFDSLLSQGAVEPPASEAPKAPPPCPPPHLPSLCCASAPAPVSSCAFGAAAPMSRMAPGGGGPHVEMLSRSGVGELDSFVDLSGDGGDDDDEYGVESISSAEDDIEEEEEAASDSKDSEGKQKKKAVRKAKAYVPPGKVRTIVERRFHSEQRPYVNGKNQFWRDYAQHLVDIKTQSIEPEAGSKKFLSCYFPEALSNVAEGILALALLDLEHSPGSSQVRSVVSENGAIQMELRAASDLILYHQTIEECDPLDLNASKKDETITAASNSLIVKQTLFNPLEKRGEPMGSFPTKTIAEFVCNTVYACYVSVSNIGSTTISDVNVLLQIPHGAVPIHTNCFYTENKIFDMTPNETKWVVFGFYFPESGAYDHFQAQAAVNGQVVARPAARTADGCSLIHVLEKPSSKVDLTSWEDICRRGSFDDVVHFVNSHSASKGRKNTVDYTQLCWRMTDKALYDKLTGFLRERLVFEPQVWRYAFEHGDLLGIREYLCWSHQDKRLIGGGLDTSVLSTMQLFENEWSARSFSFDHVEFGPLLTRRIHRVTGEIGNGTGSSSRFPFQYQQPPQQQQQCRQAPFQNFSFNNTSCSLENQSFGRGDTVGGHNFQGSGFQILHADMRKYYRALCKRLVYFGSLERDHLLVLTYFMVLMNRVEEALVLFQRLESAMATSKSGRDWQVGLDYMNAYLDFYRCSEAGDNPTQKFPLARALTIKYLGKSFDGFLCDRWKKRFERVKELIDEYDEAMSLQKRAELDRTSREPSGHALSSTLDTSNRLDLQMEIVGDELELSYENVGKCELSFYPIDIELMFSTDPFASFDASGTSSASSKTNSSGSTLLLIAPRTKLEVSLAGDKQHERVEIPEALRGFQMMVRAKEVVTSRRIESVSEPQEVLRCYFNSRLQVVVSKQCGLVQVFCDGRPIECCYVKVYAKHTSNRSKQKKVTFYKDGYTDLVGKFEYVAINNTELLRSVEQFSILVSHPRSGAVVKQVGAPVLAMMSSEFEDEEARQQLLY